MSVAKKIMADDDETSGKKLQEGVNQGFWEVDIVYYSLTGNGKVPLLFLKNVS